MLRSTNPRAQGCGWGRAEWQVWELRFGGISPDLNFDYLQKNNQFLENGGEPLTAFP